MLGVTIHTARYEGGIGAHGECERVEGMVHLRRVRIW